MRGAAAVAGKPKNGRGTPYAGVFRCSGENGVGEGGKVFAERIIV